MLINLVMHLKQTQPNGLIQMEMGMVTILLQQIDQMHVHLFLVTLLMIGLVASIVTVMDIQMQMEHGPQFMVLMHLP